MADSDSEEGGGRAEDLAADIHNALSNPSPSRTSSTSHVSAELTKVLEQWKEGGHYWQMPWPPLVVCNSNDCGLPVENIIPHIAQEVGDFSVYRAAIELRIEGVADDSQVGYDARRRRDGFTKQDWDYQTQDFVPPISPHSASKSIVVSNMMPVGDLAKKTTLGGTAFKISADCLSLKTLFDEDNTSADEGVYEGFLDGAGPGKVRKSYRREALVTLLEKDKPQILVAANDIFWAFEQVERLHRDPSTAYHKGLVAGIVKSFRPTFNEMKTMDGIAMVTDLATELLHCALRWKNVDLWQEVVPWCYLIPDELVNEASSALNTFNCVFADIQCGIDDVLEETPTATLAMSLTMRLYYSLPTIPKPWVSRRIKEQLARCESASEGDIPTLVEAARFTGLNALANLIARQSQDGEGHSHFGAKLREAVDDLRRQIRAK